MQSVLITGATSGIGLALAREYAAAGFRLILVGRRPLAALSDPLFNAQNYCQADLASENGPELIALWCRTQGVTKLDLLLHNAAAGWYGNPADQPAQSIRDLIQTNLKAPVALTHLLLPLLKRVGGKIVFVSSVASVLPTPEYAVYTATKAAVDGFARSLRIELDGCCAVQVIHPGATNTGLHAKLGISPDTMDWSKFPPAEVVARRIVRAIERGGRNVPIGFNNRLLRAAGRLFGRHLEPLLRRSGHPDASVVSPVAKRRVLITGAADGIGRALALEMARAGWEIIGLDLDRPRGEQTAGEIRAAGGVADFYYGDLADPADLERLLEQLCGPEDAPFSAVINNAGISAAGYFATMPLDNQLKVVDINCTAPLVLTARLWAEGRLAADAMPVFISSLSYFVSYPGAAVYAATKDGLASYASSLNGLPGSSRRSLVVFPGPTRTAHAHRYSPDNSREERRASPENVARQITAAIDGRKRLLLPGLGPKIFALLGYTFPRVMEWGMKRTILDKMAQPDDNLST